MLLNFIPNIHSYILSLLIQYKTLKILSQEFNEDKNSIQIEEILKPVQIDLKDVDKKDLKQLWIYDANILHLAARFNPNGLYLILSILKENYQTQKIQKIVKEYPNMFGVTPLHVAASNQESLSTR